MILNITKMSHNEYRDQMTYDASKEEEILCGGCGKNDMRNYYKIPFPEDRCSDCEEEEDVCCVGCNERVCSFNEEPPHKDSRDEAVCDECIKYI